jgi:hypothetical protein
MPGYGVGDRRVLPAQPILKTHKGLAKASSGVSIRTRERKARRWDNNLLTKSNPFIEGVSGMQQTPLGVWSNVLVRAARAHLCIRRSGVMAAAGLQRQWTGLVVSLLRGGDFLWGVP